MASFQTRDGYAVLVDAPDLLRVLALGHKWYTRNSRKDDLRYAYTLIGRKSVSIHRWLLDAPADRWVDHRNHDGLDNRRDNLRLCTPSENAQNRRHRRFGSESRFKGVSFHHASGRWQASISVAGVHYYLGLFGTDEDAAHRYDAEARKLHGDFACVNFPDVYVVPVEHRRSRDGFRGVSFITRLNKWSAVISVGGGKAKHIGVYPTPRGAARAYDAAARERFGLKARLNFPDVALAV